jgi:phosphoglycerate-specific signal transduction histidine kinase
VKLEIANKFFEQSVHYIAESDLIRSYVIDVSDRKLAQAALQQAHNELEIRVEARTAELRKINEQLRSEIVERQRLEKEARFLQAMTQAITELQIFTQRWGLYCGRCATSLAGNLEKHGFQTPMAQLLYAVLLGMVLVRT